MMKLNEQDINSVVERYSSRFDAFGYSPKTLGWLKGKQDLRFDILTSQVNLTDKSILDIGCGFGDLNMVLKSKFKRYSYFGIDMVPVLIEQGRQLYNKKNIKFQCADFLAQEFTEQYDYAIASGMFNFKLEKQDNYDFIESVIIKALSVCNEGLAFDFLSDKVDYEYDDTFHSSPEKILSIAYKYSRNVVLRNDYMPFEFSLFIRKDDSFKAETTIFNDYLKKNENPV